MSFDPSQLDTIEDSLRSNLSNDPSEASMSRQLLDLCSYVRQLRTFVETQYNLVHHAKKEFLG